MLPLAAAAITGCRGSVSTVSAREQASLELTSPSFQQGKIPRKFTCDGDEVSPALAWSAPPPSTRSFVLFVADPDAPGGTFVHWVLYDLPAEKRALPEGLSREGRLLDGSRQGRNDFDNTGYGAPCPPGRAIHHYVFTLYALDAKLDLPAGQTRAQVEGAMKGHILAHGELVARYEP
jgi:hypothetical protein